MTPANTVPNKLREKIATRNVGNAASKDNRLSDIENWLFDNRSSCASKAAITATGICFNQLMPHSGI